jgi:hypothetical protein
MASGDELCSAREFVQPILTGSKRAQRAQDRRRAERATGGSWLRVGPSPPVASFRVLSVLEVSLVSVASLDADHRACVEGMYPSVDPVWLVRFEMVESLTRPKSVLLGLDAGVEKRP